VARRVSYEDITILPDIDCNYEFALSAQYCFVETRGLSCCEIEAGAVFEKRGSLATLLHDGHGGCSFPPNKYRSPESVALSRSRSMFWRLTDVHNHCVLKKLELTPTSFLVIQGSAFSSSLASRTEVGSIGLSAEISCILGFPRSFFFLLCVWFLGLLCPRDKKHPEYKKGTGGNFGQIYLSKSRSSSCSSIFGTTEHISHSDCMTGL
jgi:hypothetical protein